MSAERLPMRKLREVVRLKLQCRRRSERSRRRAASRASTAGDYVARIDGGGADVAAAAGVGRRRGAGAAAVPARGEADARSTGAGLGARPRGAQAQARDADAAVAGVPAAAPGRCAVQPVLRSVRALAAATRR